MKVSTFQKHIIKLEAVPKLLNHSKFGFLDGSIIANENALWDILTTGKGIKHECHKLKNWEEYELGERDLTEDDFFKNFLADIGNEQLVLLFTDEGFQENCGYTFYISEFANFSELYEDYYSMEFFQLSFYLTIFPALNVCRYLDECGVIHEFS